MVARPHSSCSLGTSRFGPSLPLWPVIRLPPTGSNSSSPKPGSARPISEPRATRAPILPRTTRAAVALLSPWISESLLVWPTGALQLTRQNDDHTPCPVRLREEWRQVPDGRRTHVRYRRRDD